MGNPMAESQPRPNTPTGASYPEDQAAFFEVLKELHTSALQLASTPGHTATGKRRDARIRNAGA